MPRDLSALANQNTLSGMSGLSKFDDQFEENNRQPPMDASDDYDMPGDSSPPNEKRDELHPYCQTLSLSDVDSCTRLEEATFPPQERCTREKVSPLQRERHLVAMTCW